MKNAYFITGTDTGTGKTLVTVALLESFKRAGLVACGMKPVASGSDGSVKNMVCEDALLIKKHGWVDLPYHLVNPLVFTNPCAPNLAAEMEGRELEMGPILSAFTQISALCEVLIVEGVGGWRCPVFSGLGMADLAKSLDTPVILVVGIKLGCLNHAILSVESILSDNVALVGWVANIVDPEFQYSEQTINYLKSQIKAPLLGTVPYQHKLYYHDLSQHISLAGLLADDR